MTTYDPASHYDRVTAAWSLLLGEELHYGDFSNGATLLPQATAALTERMGQAAQLRPGIEVLDVGCGTGGPAVLIANAMAVQIIGISTSAVGIASARDRADRAGLQDRVTFEIRDGMDNGFADASFDVCWVLESSHLMRDRNALLAECARVLRPGGRLALCDIMLRRPMAFEDVRRLRKELALLREVYGDARMETLTTYEELSAKAGLIVDEIVDLTEATRPTFASWRANAREHYDIASATLGPAGVQQFLDSCDVLERFWDDGTLGYGLIQAHKPNAGLV